MRQQQARMLEPQLTPEKKIQIKSAAPRRSVPPKFHLNGLQLIKQPQSGISRCQSAGCIQNNCVGIGLLNHRQERFEQSPNKQCLADQPPHKLQAKLPGEA